MSSSTPALNASTGISLPAKLHIQLTINGARKQIDVAPWTSLLDLLREQLNLTGTKKGCDHGQCGACTVLLNGTRVLSCLTLAVMKDGGEIVTIEGLQQGDKLHPLQQAFVECDAFQCGYCTPGQICSAVGLIHEGKVKTSDDIRELMSGNICRCGAYPNIVQAIEQAIANDGCGRASMNSFSYAVATDLSGAVAEIAASANSKFIAGGTNLLDLMKENVARPSHLVDITRLPLNRIEEAADGGLRLGALVTNAETAYHPQVESRYPLLSKAILAGATAQIRNMATNGGNLLQRTRCYYFYDVATACNKRLPGSGCSAIDGLNRIHAILGTSDNCIATHPSDMCIALAALDATVRVQGTGGERAIAFRDFHRLPGDTPEIDTNLAGDEIIVSIDLPAKGFVDHHAYLKLRDRTSYAFAVVSVAVGLEFAGEQISDARLALGGVAHKPWRVPDAEKLLIGGPATAENFTRAAERLLSGARGYRYNAFKIELAKRAIVRALQQAVAMENINDSQIHRTTTEPR